MGGEPEMIDSEELDRLFDEGEEDILQYFDMEHARRPGLETHTVAVDLPARVFDALEQEAIRTGTPMQGLVEVWIAEKVGLAAA